MDPIDEVEAWLDNLSSMNPLNIDLLIPKIERQRDLLVDESIQLFKTGCSWKSKEEQLYGVRLASFSYQLAIDLDKLVVRVDPFWPTAILVRMKNHVRWAQHLTDRGMPTGQATLPEAIEALKALIDKWLKQIDDAQASIMLVGETDRLEKRLLTNNIFCLHKNAFDLEKILLSIDPTQACVAADRLKDIKL